MSSDEVRLYRNHLMGGFWRQDPGLYRIDRETWLREEAGDQFIALPAAKHAALMRVVEAARSVVGVMNVGAGHRIDWQDMEVLRELASATRVISTTAHERRGDSAKDGRKEAT